MKHIICFSLVVVQIVSLTMKLSPRSSNAFSSISLNSSYSSWRPRYYGKGYYPRYTPPTSPPTPAPTPKPTNCARDCQIGTAVTKAGCGLAVGASAAGLVSCGLTFGFGCAVAAAAGIAGAACATGALDGICAACPGGGGASAEFNYKLITDAIRASTEAIQADISALSNQVAASTAALQSDLRGVALFDYFNEIHLRETGYENLGKRDGILIVQPISSGCGTGCNWEMLRWANETLGIQTGQNGIHNCLITIRNAIKGTGVGLFTSSLYCHKKFLNDNFKQYVEQLYFSAFLMMRTANIIKGWKVPGWYNDYPTYVLENDRHYEDNKVKCELIMWGDHQYYYNRRSYTTTTKHMTQDGWSSAMVKGGCSWTCYTGVDLTGASIVLHAGVHNWVWWESVFNTARLNGYKTANGLSVNEPFFYKSGWNDKINSCFMSGCS